MEQRHALTKSHITVAKVIARLHERDDKVAILSQRLGRVLLFVRQTGTDLRNDSMSSEMAASNVCAASTVCDASGARTVASGLLGLASPDPQAVERITAYTSAHTQAVRLDRGFVAGAAITMEVLHLPRHRAPNPHMSERPYQRV